MTKVTKFLFLLLLLCFFSCSDEDEIRHPVPTIRFNISVSIINTPNLQTIVSPQYFSCAEGRPLGYKQHGIYVIQSGQGDYRAFDASCTYFSNIENHAEIKEHLKQISDSDNSTIVECSVCKSRFELLSGGVAKGPAQFGLREYQTRVEGTVLHIFN